MENASKALIMAGSVLISIMVISLLVLGYNQMSHLEQTREDADAVDKLADYMRRFEQFDRTVYGSELLSLGNLQQDYNLSDARIDVGYAPIEITVEITKEISDSEYFKPKTYKIEELAEEQEEIETEIEEYEKPNDNYNNKSAKYYSKKTNREIAIDFGYTEIPSNILEYDIEDYIEENKAKGRYSAFKSCMEDIQKYVNLKSIYNEFRTGKQFKCQEMKYDEYTGRLKEMVFVEI